MPEEHTIITSDSQQVVTLELLFSAVMPPNL